MKNFYCTRLLLLTLCFLGGQAVTNAQPFMRSYIPDEAASPREHSADITHMKVEVSFVPEKGLVKGKVSHQFKPLRPSIDTLFFDGPGIKILSATLRGSLEKESKPVTFRTNDKGVILDFNPPLKWDNAYEVVFEYEATPRKGIYFIGWNSPANTDNRNQTRRQIWTQGQGIDNRYWIPMYDQQNDKYFTETVVTFNGDYKVLSNGDLKSVKDNNDGTKTWNYCINHPHAGYLLMLAIDNYEIKKTKTSRGTPVQFWYYPEHTEKVEWTSMHTEKMIEFLEDETGVAYPWGTYSQVMVQDFLYGAMENTSATIFGDFFNVDERSFLDRNYIGVNAHELTHQWFGDLITARSGTGTWLQESFATYYAKMFIRKIDGEDEYKWSQRGEVNSALSASKNDNNPIHHTQAGSPRVYPKGSSVIQMLRYVLGDEEYKRVIKHYLEKHAYGNVETNDLNQAIQDVLGLSLDWFFEQWLYKGGEPHYKVSYVTTTGKVLVNVQQIQEQNMTTGLFKMPVKFRVHFTDGSNTDKVEWIQKISETVEIPNPGNKAVAFVLFDVNSEITKKLTFEKSFEELSAQLKTAENMIDRYDALLALSGIKHDQKNQLLKDVLVKESFWAIRAEIVKQLCSDGGNFNFLAKFMNTQNDHRVRRALLTNVKGVPAEFVDFFMLCLKDPSYQNVEIALDRLCEFDPMKNQALYLDPTRNVLGHTHNIRIKWLENAYTWRFNPDKSEEYLQELRKYCSNSYEFRTRINAFTSVKRLNYFDAEILGYLFEAAASSNRRLGQPAVELIKFFAENPSNRIIIREQYMSLPDDQKNWLKEVGVEF
jgi:aminopeptidase N